MTRNALMNVPVPVRNPDRLPSELPLSEIRRKNLAMLLAELDEVPMPEGTTPLEPIEIVDTNSEPEVLSNQDLAIALAGRFGRNLIPGGSRLAANLFAADGQDPMQLLQQYNDQDDAVFAQAPVASVASDMAGMMVPLGAAASGMRRYVDTAKRFPKVVNALSRPPAMAATGAAYGVTDQAYDRPDDGNLGTAAVMGGVAGFGGATIPQAAGAGVNALRRRFFPNHWEREADSMGRIMRENQRRRLQDQESIAGVGRPEPQQTYAPTAQTPLSPSSADIPAPASVPQGRAQSLPPPAQQIAPPSPAAYPPGSAGPPPALAQVQPSVPGSAPAVPSQVQSSLPIPQGSPVGSGPAPQPVIAPGARQNPIPRGVTYTKAHSKAVSGEIGPKIQNLISQTDIKRLTAEQRSGIADGIIGVIRDAGLPVPSKGNVERRLAKSINILRQMQQAGADITNPNVIARAFGQTGSLAVPAAIGAGAAADGFNQALSEYRQIVIDMDGDGVPDMTVPVRP